MLPSAVLVVLSALFGAFLVRADIPEENDVLVLKKDTFDKALENDFLMVEFCECAGTGGDVGSCAHWLGGAGTGGERGIWGCAPHYFLQDRTPLFGHTWAGYGRSVSWQ